MYYKLLFPFQHFRICSVLSNNKDVTALVSIKYFASEYLKQQMLQVLTTVQNAGFRVICMTTDNNEGSGNMFKLLCGGDLQSCIVDSCYDSRKLFFTVYSIKCVHSNWINQKDCKQTFLLMHFADGEHIRRTCF